MHSKMSHREESRQNNQKVNRISVFWVKKYRMIITLEKNSNKGQEDWFIVRSLPKYKKGSAIRTEKGTLWLYFRLITLDKSQMFNNSSVTVV